jgi:hypothetical protein
MFGERNKIFSKPMWPKLDEEEEDDDDDDDDEPVSL